jgi:hypothetical protein
MRDSKSDEPLGDGDGKTGRESRNMLSRSRMFQEARQQIRYCLRLLWYFLTDKPPLYTVLEDKLGHIPETQAQRIRRRWQRSRERATRQRMNKAA